MTPAPLLAVLDGNTENFLAASTPGGIEAQEKAGQIEQSFAETLPIEISGREEFEAAGFVFGKAIDDLFLEAKFPEGWRKRVTNHSMWTEILDAEGKVFGVIFYKAAFYDRSAYCQVRSQEEVSL